MLRTIVTAALLAASPLVFAQAPQGEAAKSPRKARFDCSQAKDPKACEERMAKGKAAMEKARKACEGKSGAEHSACMRTQVCAQSKDPAACEARAKEMQAKRDQVREACKGKTGDEYSACVREQRKKK
jgi:Spy/CpxP family protein refolding chaperone